MEAASALVPLASQLHESIEPPSCRASFRREHCQTRLGCRLGSPRCGGLCWPPECCLLAPFCLAAKQRIQGRGASPMGD